MIDSGLVERLCRLRGIAPEYTDVRNRTLRASDATLLAILSAMGHQVDDATGLEREADLLEELDWVRVLPPVVVLHGDRRVPFTVLAPLLPRICWRVELEGGGAAAGEVVPHELPVLGERGLRGLWYVRLALELPELPPGYHRLALDKEDGTQLAAAPLIVAPDRCHEPDAIRRGARLWGFAVQLYTLRSERNWGVGDFTDLAQFAERAAGLGADVVGLNPLHALFPADPHLASPYSPSSRYFLNVLYIDPEAVPEFAEAVEARRLVSTPEFQARLAALRECDFVDYAGVTACKLEALRLIWRRFNRKARKERRASFDEFVNKGGEALEKTSFFDVLHEGLTARGVRGGWPGWPPEYRDPEAPASQAVRGAGPGELDFRRWLQWIAVDQLAAAEDRARRAGMRLGVYRDLAVGANAGGAETWSDRALYGATASVGAPPDPLAPGGQNWGIPPMLPHELRARAYEPFIRLLRANMGRGGALRIDHVMVLCRLWWVPAGRPSSEGAYVHYRLDELMAIVALESVRHGCLVIGEDLGTVPPEIRSAMRDHGMYSYRPFFFEKSADGSFRLPDDYPRESLAAVATHDLPPLASWWNGSDIQLRERLALYPDGESVVAAREERERDRRLLLAALQAEDLLPADASAPDGRPGPMTRGLAKAVHAYLGRSHAAVMVVQPEDCLGMEVPVNVPGTSSEYPNWARKLDTTWNQMLARGDVREMARAIGAARNP
jgi:(1->4)-alpha-D-glucan 1-alpha-D-glucosylmutase